MFTKKAATAKKAMTKKGKSAASNAKREAFLAMIAKKKKGSKKSY